MSGEKRRPFEYAVVRAVPRVERGEYLNVGVLLYCQDDDYLCARTRLDDRRLTAVDPDVDVAGVRLMLEALERTCAGGDGGGPAATLTVGQRFRWLTAPRSTVVQCGPVHTGLTAAPQQELERLFTLLVG